MNIEAYDKRISTGFTLLEVVIAITIFALCITVVYSLYGSVVTVVNNVEKRVETDQGGRIVLERISDDLRGMYMGRQGILFGPGARSVL